MRRRHHGVVGQGGARGSADLDGVLPRGAQTRQLVLVEGDGEGRLDVVVTLGDEFVGQFGVGALALRGCGTEGRVRAGEGVTRAVDRSQLSTRVVDRPSELLDAGAHGLLVLLVREVLRSVIVAGGRGNHARAVGGTFGQRGAAQHGGVVGVGVVRNELQCGRLGFREVLEGSRQCFFRAIAACNGGGSVLLRGCYASVGSRLRRSGLLQRRGRFFPTLGSLVQVALGLTQRAVVIDEIGGNEGFGCVIAPRRGYLPVRHSGHDVVEAGLQVREVARPGLLGAGECGFGTATLLVSIPGSPFRRLDRLRAGCLR